MCLDRIPPPPDASHAPRVWPSRDWRRNRTDQRALLRSFAGFEIPGRHQPPKPVTLLTISRRISDEPAFPVTVSPKREAIKDLATAICLIVCGSRIHQNQAVALLGICDGAVQGKQAALGYAHDLFRNFAIHDCHYQFARNPSGRLYPKGGH